MIIYIGHFQLDNTLLSIIMNTRSVNHMAVKNIITVFWGPVNKISNKVNKLKNSFQPHYRLVVGIGGAGNPRFTGQNTDHDLIVSSHRPGNVRFRLNFRPVSDKFKMDKTYGLPG